LSPPSRFTIRVVEVASFVAAPSGDVTLDAERREAAGTKLGNAE